MTDDADPPSLRAQGRAAGRAHPAQKTATRQAYFEALAAGPAACADSPLSVRRTVAQDPPNVADFGA